MTIDKESRIPVYVQLMDIFIKQIEDGTLGEEEKLPSERELCDKYQVSRTTVRQAIQEMVKDGYVAIIRGRGTFVTSRRFNQEMSGLYSFTEYMKKLGKTISTKLIDFSHIKCDEKLARRMECKAGVEIVRFTRIRYANDEPMMIVTTHLLSKRFPGLSKEQVMSSSLYTLMSDTYEVAFTKAKETLQSVNISKDKADLLQIDVNAACMQIKRYTFDKDSLIEYAVGIVRGDKFQYDIKLQ